jgi:hypothetical protein
MTSAPIITLSGAQLPWELGVRLLDVTVERGLRRSSRAEITLEDPGFEALTDKAASFGPGTAVSVAFPAPDGSPHTVFSGAVTGIRVSCLGDGERRTAITIVAEDAMHGLDTVSKAVAVTNAGLADALLAALSPYPGSIRVEGLPAGNRDAVIVGCSPREALEQICEHYALEWWVDPADGSLNVAATPQSARPVTLTLGDDLSDLDFRATGKTTGTVLMRSWDPAGKQGLTGRNVVATAAAGGPALLTGANGFARTDPAREYESRARAAVDSTDATAQATARAGYFARSGTVLTARTVRIQPTISPRDDLALAGAGPLSGKHPVVAVRHDWGHVTGTTIIAGDRSLGAVPVPGSGTASSSPAPVVPPSAPAQMIGGSVGLLPALVTDINDPQSWGRVKVKLPTLGDDVQTGWARTILPSAGPNRGMVVPHRVNDEVLVGFEEGDLQRPVVLGAVHNGKDAAPVATAARSGDLSSGLTSANGHQIVLTDGKARNVNGVNLKHADGHQILLAGDRVLLSAAPGTPLTLQAGQASITLDAQGNVAIKGVSVTVTGQTSVDLKALDISAKADAQLTVQGTAGTTVKGATVAVSADSIASVKGATVAIN